jgi:hypothetical protein
VASLFGAYVFSYCWRGKSLGFFGATHYKSIVLEDVNFLDIQRGRTVLLGWECVQSTVMVDDEILGQV